MGIFRTFLVFAGIMIFIYSIELMVCLYFIFKKENITQWYAFIPFLNIYHYFKIVKTPFWTIFIPLVNLVVLGAVPYKLAKQYDCKKWIINWSIPLSIFVIPYVAFSDLINKDIKKKINPLKSVLEIDEIDKANSEEEIVNLMFEEYFTPEVVQEVDYLSTVDNMIKNIEDNAIKDDYFLDDNVSDFEVNTTIAATDLEKVNQIDSADILDITEEDMLEIFDKVITYGALNYLDTPTSRINFLNQKSFNFENGTEGKNNNNLLEQAINKNIDLEQKVNILDISEYIQGKITKETIKNKIQELIDKKEPIKTLSEPYMIELLNKKKGHIINSSKYGRLSPTKIHQRNNQLLNMVYGYTLINLNALSENYPGIDLGDSEHRICVQVTSDRSRKKVEKTITTFKDNNYKDTPSYNKTLLINYFSNQIFSFLFFTIKSPFLALIDTFIVFISSLFLYYESKELNKTSAKLLIPYIIWNMFALILIISIFFMNL